MTNRLMSQSVFSIKNQCIWCRIYCAHDQKMLERLIYIEFVEGDPGAIAKDRERGMLLGYAKTAVEVYVKGEGIHKDKLPDLVKKSCTGPISLHLISVL